MPEGIAVSGRIVSGGVHDDADSKPEPSAEAPRGWTWDRPNRAWKPKTRGKILWEDGSDPAAESPGPEEPRQQQEQRDPAPSWAREDDKPGKGGSGDDGKVPFESVPQSVKDDIAGLAGLVATPILALAQQIDPYCGGALAQCFEPALDATLPLICRSSKIVKYFAEDKSDWLLWGKVAMALTPFAQAVFQHHIVRTVEVVRDEKGDAYVQPRQAAAPADHLTPKPQPEFRYAA
jgi:hypothetical protein